MLGLDPSVLLIIGAVLLGVIFFATMEDPEEDIPPGSEAEADVGEDGTYIMANDSDVPSGAAITVNGNEDDNIIETGSGNDVLYGGGSYVIPDDLNEVDLLDLEDGIVDGEIVGDFYSSGAGHDILFGDEGIDVMVSGAGMDVMYGGAGEDDLSDFDFDADHALSVAEALASDEAVDYDELFNLNDGRSDDDDAAYGGEGDDTFGLYWGSDTAYGGAGNDYFEAIDWGSEAGSDVLFGGDGDDGFLVDGGDTVTAGDGEDYIRYDGSFNAVDDLQEGPVVITDFEIGVDVAEYVIGFNALGQPFIPVDAEFATAQQGNDVHIGADIPDENGTLDGSIDFLAVVLENQVQADVDAAIAAGFIFAN